MSAHESYSTLVNSRAPRSTLGAQRNFKTWSSIDQDLAARNALAGHRVIQSVARVRSQEDRALFREAVLNIVVPLGAALVAVSTGVSFGVSIAYWFI